MCPDRYSGCKLSYIYTRAFQTILKYVTCNVLLSRSDRVGEAVAKLVPPYHLYNLLIILYQTDLTSS